MIALWVSLRQRAPTTSALVAVLGLASITAIVGLQAMLVEREPGIYRRYAHWWSKLPPGEVRVLDP